MDTDRDHREAHAVAPPAPPHVSSGDGDPVMDQHAATEVDKIAGIVAQTRADVGAEPVERIADVLHQRLGDAGIDLSDDEIAQLARTVAASDA